MSIKGWAVREFLRRRASKPLREAVHALEDQQDVLTYLLNKASDTAFGKEFRFRNIRQYQDFQQQVPLRNYEALKPFFDRTLAGEQNIFWPDKILWFSKSSGTSSDKSKYLPVTQETLQTAHYKGAFDVMSMYCHHRPDTSIFNGKTLIIGGSLRQHEPGSKVRTGDISAVMMYNQPFLADLLRTPSRKITLMEDFEAKLQIAADVCIKERITGLAGVPTWNIVLLKMILEKSGKNNMTEVWPDMELYLHGGVNFDPYQSTFEHLLPHKAMQYWQIYNASEGFFAYQDRPFAHDMLLATHHGIFYEFIPQGQYFSEQPDVVSLKNVQVGQQYALVISTNSGLWRYIIGDTIEFTSVQPYRIRVTGRIKSFINAFGEEVIVDNTDKALFHACRQTGAEVKDYTVAPRYFDQGGKGSHEWLIEFDRQPEYLQLFTEALDKALQQVNSDYEAKRSKDLALTLPVVHIARQGLFFDWLKKHNRVGAQNKVARLNNDRKMLEELLSM